MPNQHTTKGKPKATLIKPVRWTAEGWREIEEAAAAAGLDPSEYVRDRSTAAARRERKRRDRTPPTT
jgi:hypothetical protein